MHQGQLRAETGCEVRLEPEEGKMTQLQGEGWRGGSSLLI